MKQVIFAIALLAMASLTGCLTDDESSVDETTDTTSDNTGNTNDNSNDNTDSGDDGMIDPVGTDGGVTIPEDSSIFMDSPNDIYSIGRGSYDCEDPRNEDGFDDDEEDYTCVFTYYNNDFFKEYYDSENNQLSGISYLDSDGIANEINFNGWINKTGNQVTIEALYYPERGMFYSYTNEWDWNNDGTNEDIPRYNWNVDSPVSSTCTTSSPCEIRFYGYNGLEYNAQFKLTQQLRGLGFAIDYDNDGVKDSFLTKVIYQKHTANFDLPFEPYGFSLSYGDGVVDRIF